MKINILFSILLITSFLSFTCVYGFAQSENKFLLGNEVLLKNSSHFINGKKLGLIVNNGSVLSDGMHLIDKLSAQFNVVKIFTPEHGLRGNDLNEDYYDDKSGINVISLYGSKKKPSREDLLDTDILIYDIQDVGARFYTYINTLFYCMESCFENDKQILVCDRPMIANADYTDGFLLDKSQSSFVGLLDIPIAYGMTCGELAGFINDEYFDGKCMLNVVKMENYSRDTDYESLKLPWIKPSPNLYYPSSATTYAGTCLFEGTNFSEGRGSDKPFEYVGAPYCDGNLLAKQMNSLNLAGVTFESITFIPSEISSPSNPPKYVNETCGGVYVKVTDKKIFEPVKTGISLLYVLNKYFPDFEIKKNKFLDKLAGTESLRLMLNDYTPLNDIFASYKDDLNKFNSKREKYLLY